MELPDLNEMEDVILTLEEEDGTETECQVIAMFEYDDAYYAAVTPTDENIAEAYLFGVEFEDKGDEVEFTLTNIEDQNLLEEVGAVFESIMEQADDDELPEGVEIETESKYASESDDDGDDQWDEFIHKKLEDL
ncbi:MAG: DUF1292 domain-containing protein [Eubacterium sp.]|nr:DUF1292 domain-containing protein [Eubacterium sp.]